jgi:hypothetical protein
MEHEPNRRPDRFDLGAEEVLGCRRRTARVWSAA